MKRHSCEEPEPTWILPGVRIVITAVSSQGSCTWVQRGQDVSFSGHLRRSLVVNVDPELVRLLNCRRRNGYVADDNVGALLAQYPTLGFHHSILLGIIA